MQKGFISIFIRQQHRLVMGEVLDLGAFRLLLAQQQDHLLLQHPGRDQVGVAAVQRVMIVYEERA